MTSKRVHALLCLLPLTGSALPGATRARADACASAISDARNGASESSGTCLPAARASFLLVSDTGVHDVARGDPDRKAILDAVRAANADLNDQIAIVFVVDILRSDGRTAYFRGAVRRKSDGQPIDAATWGECEQDPEDAVLEALLEKRNGRWRAIKANRCADDVFFTDEERSRYREFLSSGR